MVSRLRNRASRFWDFTETCIIARGAHYLQYAIRWLMGSIIDMLFSSLNSLYRSLVVPDGKLPVAWMRSTFTRTAFFANFQRRSGDFRTHLRPFPNFPARKTARDGGDGVAVKLWPRTPSYSVFLRKFGRRDDDDIASLFPLSPFFASMLSFAVFPLFPSLWLNLSAPLQRRLLI